MEEFGSTNRGDLDKRKELAVKIEEQELILSAARKKRVTEEIDDDDFRKIKAECNEELRKLESKLEEMPTRSGN